MIFISNRFFDLVRGDNSLKKHLREKDIEHYLFTCDLVEYNFKDVYKTFNLSYFSKSSDLIGNQFADSQHLRNYESIGNVTQDLIEILIKKFKLKISFRKNTIFSNQIIISECVDFDPEKLPNDDSIIKIAIVKDNLNEWINTNLNKYDYIFTLKEDFNELKGNRNCYINKGETVFEQIKNILNELYGRKLEKFHYFIKDVGFNNVFPKKNHYFKVLNSEYFDGDWYKDEYNLTNNTDPVIHYLLVGYNKGYDPGPNFSHLEYHECNKDIGNVNPLVHYEVYGRKENRIIRISDKGERDYNCILNSPYFDKEWYENTYEIHDEDLIAHYLNVGYLKGYNPGPDFSTFEYLVRNDDVKKMSINPLLHYELLGRRENRKIMFEDDVHQTHYSLIADSPLFDKEWYGSTYGIDDDVDCVDHYLNIGYVKGYDASPDFITSEYYGCNKDVEEYGMNPLLHYELYGKKEERMIWISDMNQRDYNCILNSNLFDKEWYGSTYGIDDDVDCVDHYLNVGVVRGYNPGPDFSTFEYYVCNNDAKIRGVNPLVHYELFGRKENRKFCFSDVRHKEDHDYILNSPYFDKDWYESNYDLNGFDSVYHYLNIGFTICYNPGPDFSTFEYYECNVDVKEYGMNPLLHYERFGRKEGRKLSLKDK